MPRIRGRAAPYLLILPAGMWTAVFFAIPLILMLSLSLQEGNLVDGFRQTFRWRNYTDALGTYGGTLGRSLGYGLLAGLACIVLAYPAAYWIATRGGRHKSTYLLLLLLPFFVSSILRTVSWRFVLADNGILLGPLKGHGLLPEGFHVLDTGFAVLAGLTYTYLPFMLLPIYVALERIDPALVEAAQDLYARRGQAFLRVVLPLSLPGVFAGVIMTFVPVSADYVNAALLGGPGDTMIGNVIQTAYFGSQDYPAASALSFTLMAVLVAGIFLYARLLGTENVPDAGRRRR